MDGHFSGWVAPAVCAELGIASTAAEAWWGCTRRMQLTR
jgi:hypothetical protein